MRSPADVLAYVAALGGTEPEARPGSLAAVGLVEEIDAFFRAEDPPFRKWRKVLKFDHVPFDAWGDWPRFYAVFARKPDDSFPIGVFSLKGGFVPEPRSMLQYLEYRFGRPTPTPGGLYLRLSDAGPEVSPEAFARPQLDLSASIDIAPADRPVLRPVAQAGPRLVEHPKFGRGTVVHATDDRITADFGDHGVRTLLSRFVRELDPADES